MNGVVSTPTTFANPGASTLEIWFRTATNGYAQGGKLAGLGNARTGTSTQYDRYLYMLNTGELVFGTYPGSVQTVQSTTRYNDAQWHHSVATVGSGGIILYVDGTRVARNTRVTAGENYTGYLRVGYDNLNGWTGAPTSYGFQGYVDEFAYYSTALSQARVTAHWGARSATTYPSTVTGDSPQIYHRFNDYALALDSSGNNRVGGYVGGAAGGAASALLSDANAAVNLDGTAAAYVPNAAQLSSPGTFSIELWLRAATGNRGGRLLGFGSALTGASATTTSDRHLYMRDDGRLVFGVYGATAATWRVVQSPVGRSYADGNWHHVVGTFEPGSMRLYVDGVEVQADTTTVATTNYTGYWRIGADVLTGWTGVPTNTGFRGDVDEVAVYTGQLSAARVAAHHSASGR